MGVCCLVDEVWEFGVLVICVFEDVVVYYD